MRRHAAAPEGGPLTAGHGAGALCCPSLVAGGDAGCWARWIACGSRQRSPRPAHAALESCTHTCMQLRSPPTPERAAPCQLRLRRMQPQQRRLECRVARHVRLGARLELSAPRRKAELALTQLALRLCAGRGGMAYARVSQVGRPAPAGGLPAMASGPHHCGALGGLACGPAAAARYTQGATCRWRLQPPALQLASEASLMPPATSLSALPRHGPSYRLHVRPAAAPLRQPAPP